ncbi:interferon-inducible GTPase 5 [Gadus morhua]|uniref:interferon-inducible GTPase 5 n=1 Tax=Gadus morhua TaxID=8049 RepID=UPI0011B76358|nr:interferon-inducible GTPase 5-like [Gadus morhua]
MTAKAMTEKIKKYLEEYQNVKLDIAITGESGSGKSTFVNAFRGIDNRDDRAAPTGVVETTMKPEPYPHPIYPNVTIWDLPGVGTTTFSADQYLEHVEFKKYDFFIVVSGDRFSENDVMLAQEIKRMDKKFYFVRSKIDDNLRAEKKSQRNYNEKNTLQQIRGYCIQELEKQGLASSQVFLVSSFHLHLYDFSTIQDTMEEELSSLKKYALTLAFPNINQSSISKKKEVFRSQIIYYVILSAAVAVVPIPGLSFCVDLVVLDGLFKSYLIGFGLDVVTLNKLSTISNIPLEDLMAECKCTLSGQEITATLVVKFLTSFERMGMTTAEEDYSMISILGDWIAARRSFVFLKEFLNSLLDGLFDDAINVQKKVGISKEEQ